MKADVRAHFAAIDAARGSIKRSMNEIRKHQRSLIRRVVETYNELSVCGTTVESRGIVLGFRQCEKSPIDVCAYAHQAHEAMSIPGQLEYQALLKKKEHDPSESDLNGMSAATRTDACLFCGVPVTDEQHDVGQQLVPATKRKGSR